MKKILVIRLSSIGDIVLTTPVIRCLKQQLPGAVVHFAVKKPFLPVVGANPYIDKFHIYDGDLKALTTELKAERFDFILDLHRNFRSRYIRLRLGVPSRGFPKLNFRKWLLARFKIDLMPRVHIVDRYFRAARPLGICNDGQGLDYFIPPGEKIDLENLPDEFERGYIAFVIGAKHATKTLPVHQIVAVCRLLNRPVALLGGNEDAQKADRIIRETGSLVFSFCGMLSVSQSASLVQQAEAVITHDTGLMHIAAAFGKKVISVWGSTVPAFGMAPYMPKNPDRSVMIQVSNLSCRPCSKLGYDRCPKGHFRCMEEQEPEKIARQTLEGL